MKRSLHGLVVERETDLDVDPLGPFFGAFPLADGAASLSMTVLGARAPARRPEKRPVYFLGAVQVSRDDEGWSLFDGESRADLSLDGRRLDAEVPVPLPALVGGILHAALLLALRLHGFFELHAAALSFGDRSALLVGDAGVGKTTALFSCVDHGARFLSDDRVLFRDDDRLLAYPREAHLSTTTIAALPALQGVPLAGPALHDKRRADVRAWWPGRHVLTAPAPSVLLFPEITADGSTQIVSMPRADALGSLIAASALATLPEVPLARENLARLGALADRTRAGALWLGRDALVDPGVVAQALALRLALPALIRLLPLDRLLGSLDRSLGRASVDDVRRAVSRSERLISLSLVVPDTCLYRALTRYALLASNRHDAAFVLAVVEGEPDVTGHAWAELDGAPFDEELFRAYTVTLRHRAVRA